MKVNKINESAVTSIDKLLTEDISSARERVRQYLEDVLDHAFDNIAIAATSEVEDYEADWCTEDIFGPQHKRMMKARYEFLNAMEVMMFANAPQNEALTEASMDRKATKRLLEMIANGVINAEELIKALLNYLPEYVVRNFAYSEGYLFDYDDEDQLTESLLNEGPVRDALRGIQNKIDPKGAKGRATKDAGKDLKKARDKAEIVLSKDFNMKYKDAKFYKNKDYKHPIDWETWRREYGTEISADDPKYAEWYNAIVTTADGYYIRRGAEDLSRKLMKFIPGKNDEVAPMYKWGEDKSNADKPKEEPTKEEKPKTSKGSEEPLTPEEEEIASTLLGKSKDDKGTSKPSSPEKAPTKKKAPTPGAAPKVVKDKDLDGFRKLAKLTALKVLDASGNPLKATQINTIKTTDLNNYKVQLRTKTYPLDQWIISAKKAGFLQESYLRNYNLDLNEDVLTEDPAIKFTPDEMNNPNELNFKKIIKDRTDKENAEKEAKAAEERRAELRAKSGDVIQAIEMAEDLHDKLHTAFEKLVPPEGSCETVAGELVRAIMKIMYRDLNDGDKFFMGYGIETCGGAAMYLFENGFDDEIKDIVDFAFRYVDNDDAYTKALNSLCEKVLNKIIENPELLETENTQDMHDMDTSYLEENQPTFEYTIEVSDDLYNLIQEHVIDSNTLISYVEDRLSDSQVLRGAETGTPWGHYDTSVDVEKLTYEGLVYLEEELCFDIESFWADLVNEYEEEDEDDEDEEEFDENLNKSSLKEDYDFVYGSDVIDGLNGNMDNDNIDRELRLLNRIARKLGLKRADDIVAYVDVELMYDPTYFDGVKHTTSGQLSEYEVNGINFLGQMVNGNLWLYFRNETDGEAYLRYASEEGMY